MSLQLTLKQIEQLGTDAEMHQVDMMVRCMSDPDVFAKKVFKHYEPIADDIIQFAPYQFQTDLLELMQTHDHLCVKKSRNIGLSTTIECYIAWLLTVNPHATIVYATNNMNTFHSMSRTIADFITNDDVFNIGVKASTNSLVTDTGSRLIGCHRDRLQYDLRGFTINYLIIDRDFGFEDDWVNNLNPLIPAMTKGSKLIELVNINSESLFDNIFECKLPWNIVPGRDETFKKNMIDRIGDDAWLLQYGE